MLTTYYIYGYRPGDDDIDGRGWVEARYTNAKAALEHLDALGEAKPRRHVNNPKE